jgi:hypothetical protein
VLLTAICWAARRDDLVLILWTDGANRRFQFNKRRQLFIRTHNETLPVVAMASATKIVRARESMVATQPQLQPVRADFRQLVMALLWIAYYARGAIDFRIFRMLVRIESGFTYLLVSR